ncbi:1-acyl-sn-glycerol-3-phosphate acyltransferase [Vibrio fluvialis]|jgi:1-acyl-sn-glycerol-3-phosphate acyltransferase|uniref:1-acyl-sn-glycerol-3-phosphate acyltransferase n=1 Tax=Vibrio fluvialis TaxID=676 RepID=UPI0006E2F5B3|nr:1-acyl-sn-glycerol-3-phosphate acyltransferase [Vibrio fluvialis]EKO3367160.1 1-acyl-sn-glycerol-3-phosphate acyltransferase [Vibrio fluvialis]EKO3538479.1 1-acyl-sn-glycerol-3-phosphate acyltransferase [Vibrio fluvialis]EKO3555074.1 1-acyl-sn-glycerol-3-phosphate acyltransferase [Vibrio fluvialis]EKO3941600.1 1-acyl-sn-glycerol-3-phosphate acyltransferase [Vibrio fluvialis]EKO5122732.1 1-acyl-sn-glycerol-3-phosphate acyltransferase [Vibrio fluvialis]
MTSTTDPFVEIRPYNDDEIPAAIDRLINDEEFIAAILQHRFERQPSWLKSLMGPFVKAYLKFKWAKLTSVEAIQLEVKKYLDQTLEHTTRGVTYSGLNQLDKNTAYLFVSNHRDIAMDPALVNYGLHITGHRTVRIAIGDNLLKKPCATELMKLNKSFIVKRSAKGPREMMKALGTLSGYIKHSLDTGNSIWIAQKEGRAKDGNDFTDPAILKMFHVEGRKQKMEFADYVKSLRIVPVSIAYENDPCDIAKARELYEKATHGKYEKAEFEDIESIIQGIVGDKGRVHVAFGSVIDQTFETPEALADEIDRQIHENYQLYPINLLAAGEESEDITPAVRAKLNEKLAQLPEGAHTYLLDSYANPVRNRK